MEKRWQLLKPDFHQVETLRTALKIHPVTAQVLVNRNIHTIQDAMRFLQPRLDHLRSPSTLKDMDVAVNRIVKAIDNQEQILIFGDYDADGVTATVVLFEFLRKTGAQVDWYIPHRIDEGYGFHSEHVRQISQSNDTRLIITVDCGVSSHDAVLEARNHGIDVIITDHHNVEGRIPNALAVINPKRTDCPSGMGHLAGVGVAFSLIICLRKALRDNNFWKHRPEPNLRDMCDLVCLGTVADVVPLVAENRILSKIGIQLINEGRRTGIHALKMASGIGNGKLESGDLAFKLAPRINAAGRVDHARTAMELLCSTQADAAMELASTLNTLNTQRQDEEQRIFKQALDMIQKDPTQVRPHTITLACADWHEGILGIVCSRLLRKYYRPVVLISVRDGVGKGSARSIPGIDLYQSLCACADDLVGFGGHSMAAGLRINAQQIPQFQEHFEQVVAQMSSPKDYIPQITIDAELGFQDINGQLMDEMEWLKPFGAGNPEPVFMARNVEVSHSRIVGGKHRKMTLRQRSSPSAMAVQAIHFNANSESLQKNYFDKLAFHLRWNHFNGNKTIQLVVESD